VGLVKVKEKGNKENYFSMNEFGLARRNFFSFFFFILTKRNLKVNKSND
jgi:hypothetical protein